MAGSVSTAFAGSVLPNCGADNLQNYITLTANPPTTGGCAIGILDYYDFSYHLVSGGLQASAIAVTPLSSGFSFGPVSVAAGQTLQFEIDYDLVVDPAPIITGDKLKLDPPTGDVTVTEYFCNDLTYTYTGSCEFGFQPESLTVGTPSSGYPSDASITFNPPATTQQVGILFTLIGGANGASFDGLDSASTVESGSFVVATPEPPASASLLLGMALLTLALVGRRRAPPIIN
jgi:MYXO-CTERM domain-containing protein